MRKRKRWRREEEGERDRNKRSITNLAICSSTSTCDALCTGWWNICMDLTFLTTFRNGISMFCKQMPQIKFSAEICTESTT